MTGLGPRAPCSSASRFGAILLNAVWPPRVRGRSRNELLLAVVFGLVLATMNLSFYESIHRIPLGTAVTLEFVGPLAVAVAGSRRPLDLVWVALALLGIAALARRQHPRARPLGVALALFAGCLWGCYILLNGRVGRVFERGTGVALSMCVASVALLPVGIAAAGSELPASGSAGDRRGSRPASSAIPYSFEQEALRRIAASLFGVLMSLEPAVAAVAGLIVLGQSLSARDIVGIALVVAASAGASCTPAARRSTPEPRGPTARVTPGTRSARGPPPTGSS